VNRTDLFPYPWLRALEDAAYARGVVPTRIFALLLPVWAVTIQADITEAEDYELIDRFLARGIAEGGLYRTAELADFYALDRELVDRALRALAAIGHLSRDGDRWTLTELGLRSVRDRKRYIRTREDRRKLYFAAPGSQPLTRQYYDARRITLLPAAEITEVRSRSGPQFQALAAYQGLDARALEALAANPDRDRLNLPERIDRPRRLGSDELVYLPLYVVRGRTPRGGTCHLAYNQAVAEADADMSDLIDTYRDLVGILDTEVTRVRHDDELKGVRGWLAKRGLDEYRPEPASASRPLRVSLPASRFGDNGGLALNQVGSFVVLGNGFFQLWCADKAVRTRALLTRLDGIMASRSTVDRETAVSRIGRVTRQLELGTIGLTELAKIAEANGHRGLAAQLRRLS
jgi:hypothetical protein